MSRHWRRVAALATILGSMVLVYSVSDLLYTAIVSLSLVVLPVADWTVFAILLWTSKQAPEIDSLRERVDDMLTLSIAATTLAVIGALVFGRIAGFITIQVGPIVTIGLGFAAVLISVPALGALRTWRDVWLPKLRERVPIE